SSLRKCIEQINQYLRGWADYFGVANWVGGIARTTDKHIRRRLRGILLAQWKDTKTIRRKLIELGTPPSWARHTGGSSSPWRRSNCNAVTGGIRNEWFERWGLLSLDDLCAARLKRGLPLAER